ncbi:MAG TPA: PKD-like domain-containing protein [Chryseosolibacter sp.]
MISFATNSLAQTTFTSNVASGDYNVAGSWLESGTNDLDNIPDANDLIVIRAGDHITVTSTITASSLTFDASSGATGRLTVNTGVVYTVTNAITQSSSSTLNTFASLEGLGTVSCASLNVGSSVNPTGVGTITTTFTTTVNALNITGNLTLFSFIGADNTRILNSVFSHQSGTVDVNLDIFTNIEDDANEATYTMTEGAASGTLQLSAAGSPFTIDPDGTTTIDFNGLNSTVNYDRAGNQTILATVYNNLWLSGSGTKTINGVSAINGDLRISGGTATPNTALTIGDDVILQGGTFNASTFTHNVAGDWTNNGGTFTPSTSTINFNGTAAQEINGTASSQTFYRISVNNTGVLTNNETLTVSNRLSGTGSFAQGVNSTLTFPGTTTGLTNFDASASGNTVNYTGSSQTVFKGTYVNLNINQASGEAILENNATINGLLTLTAGNLNIAAYTLNFGTGASAVAGGPFSSSKMIIASGGSEVRKYFSGAGTFAFPIGDNTGISELSALTVTVPAPGATSYVGVSIVDLKHPSNASSTYFLSRYWNITHSNPANWTVDLTADIVAADVNGAPTSEISSAVLQGTFSQTLNPWDKFAPLGASVVATGVTLQAGTTAVLTGITGDDPAVTINPAANPICPGSSVVLTASVTGGDPTLLYTWTGTGLSSTTIQGPTATPTASPTGYSVYVIDGNGIQSNTANLNVTFHSQPATPTISATPNNTVCDGTGPADVTLTSSAAPNSGSYAWYKNGVSTGQTTQSIDLTSASDNGDYTVRVTDGASPFCQSVSSAVTTVTINPVPTDLVVSSSSTSICVGETVTLTIAASVPGINYTIRDQANTVVSATAGGNNGNLSITTNALTAASTVLHVIAAHPTTLCSRVLTNTFSITYSATAPTVGVTGALTTCVGAGSTVLTSSAGAGYQWYKDGVAIPSEVSQTLTLNHLIANTGSYQVTHGGTCAGAFSTAVNFVVNDLPADQGVSAVGSTNICAGQTVTIRVTAAQSGVNYQVFDGATQRSSLTPGTGVDLDIVTSAIPADATLTVIATNGSTSCARTLSNTVVVDTDLVPAQPTITVSGTAQPFCEDGGTSTVVLTSSAGAGNVWYRNGVATGQTGTSITLTTAAQSGSYTVQVTGAAPTSCTSAMSAASVVTINASPTISYTVSTSDADNTICVGDALTLTLSSSQTGINYQVFDNTAAAVSGIVGGTGSSLNIAVTPTTASTTLTVRATNSVTLCTADLTDTETITVNPIPSTPTITVSGTAQPFCEDGGTSTVVLTSSAASGNVWYKNGVATGQTGTSITLTTAAQSGSYTVQVLGAAPTSCTSAMSAASVVTINASPTISYTVTTSDTDNTICVGDALSLTLSGSQAGVNYHVIDNTSAAVSTTVGGNGGALVIPVTPTTASTSLTVVATPSVAGCAANLTDVETITVNPIPSTPTITVSGTAQPFCEDGGTSTVVLTSSAASGNVWYKNGVATGQTGTSITLTTAAQSGSYTVQVTGAAPTSCTSAMSAASVVTINASPTINYTVTTSDTDNTICVGDALSLTLAGSQTGVNYHVIDNTSAAVSTTVGGNGGALVIPVTPTTASTSLTVVATPSVAGCAANLTDVETITVNPIPATPTITVSGTAQPFCEDGGTSTVVLTSSAGAGNVWYRNGVATGQTGTSITLTTAAQSGSYTVQVTGAAPTSCTSAMSAASVVTINATPSQSPTFTLAATPVCENSTASLALSASQSGVNYEVIDQSSNLVSGVFEGNGGLLVLTTAPLAVSVTNLRIRAKNSLSGCTVVLTDNENIVITPLPVGTSATIAAVCSDTDVIYAPSVSGASSYAISINSNGLPQSAGAGTANDPSDDRWTNTTAFTVNVLYSIIPVTSGGCAGAPYTITVPITPEPLGVSTTAIVCSGDAFTYDLQADNIDAFGNTLTSSFTWSVADNTDPNVTGEPVGTFSTAAINNTFINTTSGDQTVTYNVTPTSGGCVGDAFNIVVTIRPQPIGSPLTLTVCSDDVLGGSALLSTASGSVAASSYQIVSITNTGTLPASSGLPGPGSISANGLQDDAWTNTTGSVQQIVYNLRAISAAGCDGAIFTVTVNVRPETAVQTPVTTSPVCSDSNVGYTPSVSGASTYTVSINSNGLTQSAGDLTPNDPSDDRWTNTTTSVVNVVYTITPATSFGCGGAPYTVTVPIRPEPVGVPLTLTVCSDTPLGSSALLTTASSSVGASTYNITSITSNGLAIFAGGPATGAASANELVNDAWTNTTGGVVQVIYDITPISAAGCSGNPFTVTINVNPETATTSSSTLADICSDAAVNYTLNVTNASSYTISTNSNGLVQGAGTVSAGVGKASGELLDDSWTNTTLNTVNVVYTITPTNGGCSGDVFTLTVPVRPEPRGINDTKAICSNSSVNYNIQTANIDALGNDLPSTFTWIATDNVNVSGETLTSSTAVTISDVLINTSAVDQVVVYTVTPVGSVGLCTGDVFTVSITVRPQPVSNSFTITACSDTPLGTAATLSTIAGSVSATSYTINSITSTLSSSAGSPATGSVNATNLVNDAWTNTSGGQLNVVYNITPVSSAGCNGTPFTVTVVVDPEPAVTAPILRSDVCSDLQVGYTLTVSGASSYTISTNAGGLIQSGGSISAGSGKGAAELFDDRWTNTTLNTVNVVYTITPFSATCAGDVFTVTVPIRPEPRGVSDAKAICSNSSVSYNLQTVNINGLGNALPSTFTWIATDNTNVTGETLSNSNAVTIADVLVNTTAVDQQVVYTVTPTGSVGGCAGDVFTVTVTVRPEPVSNSFVLTVCSDTPLGNGATLTTVATSVSAASYLINSITTTLTASAGTPATGSVSASNLIDDAWTNTSASPVSVIYNITPVSSAGCSGTPFNVTIQVNPEPAVTAPIVTSDICSDLPVGYNLSVSGASTYTISTNSNGLTQSLGSVSAGSGKSAAELADDRWTNTTLNTVNVVYTITPFNGTCAGNVFTVTVPVRPEPRGVNDTKLTCSNAAVNYDLQAANIDAFGNDLPSGFTWIAASNANVSGETTSGTNTGTISDILVNTTSVDQVVVYTVTPVGTVSGCTGDAFTISVTVRPEPVLSTSLGTTICSDAVAGITLATNGSSVVAASYTINNVVVSPGLSAHGTNATLGAGKTSMAIFNDRYTNTTTGDLTVTYTVTPLSSAGCSGAQQSFIVTVRPEPVISATLNRTVCSDVAGGLVLSTTGSVAASSYAINSINVASGLTPASGNITIGSGYAANAISGDIFTNSTANPLTVVYNVIPTTSLGCNGNSIDITVTILPEPRGNSTLEQPVCSDVPFSFDAQNNIANGVVSTFTWTAVFPSGLTGGATSGSGNIAGTLTNVTNGILQAVYTVTATGQSSTCVGNSFTITVPIRPEPVGVADVSTVCSDNAINYNLINNVAILGNNVGSTFSWVATDNASVTGESLTPQSNVRITNIINNVTNTPQNVTYSVTPTSASGCVGNAFAISVTVNPEPVGITSTHVICSDLAVAYDLQNNVNVSGNNLPTVFNWSATANGVVDGEGTLVKTASVIDDVLRNPSNNVENVLYTINPSAQGTGCLGNTFTVNVSVNPRAKISAGPDLELCRNFPGIALQGAVNYAPNGITWTGGQGTYSSTSNPNAVYSFKDPQEVNTAFTLTMTATDPDGAGPCPIETDQMTLRINPLPIVIFTGLPSGSPPQMAENMLPITLTGNQVGGVFTISPITSNIGSTIVNPVDKAVFDPDAVDLGSNLITYTFTDSKGCVNSNTQEVIVNPITNVDFTIQGATLNSDGQYEICADLGLVKLIGFPAASSGLGPETQFTSVPAFAGGPTATIFFDGTDYFIQTNSLVSQTYRIRYDYKNAFGAITFKIRDVKIFASPVSLLTSANNCIASDVVFTDLSTINPTPFPTNIVSWQWDFDDNSTSAMQNPSKRYADPDTYNVRLRVGTGQGCFDMSDVYAVRVGAVPVPDFKWSAICNSEFTKFEDISTNPGNVSTITDYTWTFGDGNSLIGQAGQSVPAGTNGGATQGSYARPDHQYAAFNTYDVTLSVRTNDGCANTITKKVFILPYSTVRLDARNVYLENFETSDGGWIAEADLKTNPNSDTSWVWGLPTGAHITSGANGSQKAWWTGSNTTGDVTYFNNENSFVNGPCFDLTKLERPMVSLDYFADFDVFDGAVLQYSIDGGNNWRIVGNEVAVGEGINWFNGRSVLSNPGNQTVGPYAWTGNKDQSQGTWKNARFNLDMVPVASRKQVRLRIALASNDLNPEGEFDGFAFDNFFVGNKKRTVMVEHFTNTTSTSAKNANDYLDNLYADQSNWHAAPDFFKLQYHMSVPAFDQLNRDNPSDPGARSFFYNVTSPPHTLMDGLVGSYYGKALNGDHAQIDRVELDRRALEDPEFLVDTAIFQAAANDVLRAQVSFSYASSKALTSPVIFQVALVEDNVNGNRNVLRKLLLQSEGLTVSRSWSATDVQTVDINYPIDVPVVDPANLYLVAFVQDKTTRKILQARIFKAPAKVGITPVGIEDDPATAEIRNINVYPNPASQRINFYLENQLTGDYGWHIVDQRGVTVLKGELSKDLTSPQQVPISSIANGIYFVRFTRGDKTVVYRKIAVMNSN